MSNTYFSGTVDEYKAYLEGIRDAWNQRTPYTTAQLDKVNKGFVQAIEHYRGKTDTNAKYKDKPEVLEKRPMHRSPQLDSWILCRTPALFPVTGSTTSGNKVVLFLSNDSYRHTSGGTPATAVQCVPGMAKGSVLMM